MRIPLKMYRPSSVFTSDPKKSEARLVEKRRRRKGTVIVSFNRLISCATTPHNNTLARTRYSTPLQRTLQHTLHHIYDRINI